MLYCTPCRYLNTYVNAVMEQLTSGVKVHTRGRITHGPSIDVDDDLFSFRGGSTGVIRIQEPLNPILNYFELEILDKGAESSIGIGAGERSYPLTRMPGWNKSGIGYHGDDGRLYHESGRGTEFGPTCTEGDRMGCGVDFSSDVGYGYVDIFFTKNGKQVGDAVRMKRPVYGLYPLVGLHSHNEKVRYLGHWRRVPDSLLEPMEQDHSPSSAWLRSNGVKFLDDGLTLNYCGDSSHIQDVGIAQSRQRLDRSNHYFEMEILSTGSKGALAIGLAKLNYPLHVHPGWNAGAIGYHADDGKVFIGRGQGDVFGPTCEDGDRMGCGIRYSVSGDEVSSEGSDSSDEEEGMDNVGLGHMMRDMVRPEMYQAIVEQAGRGHAGREALKEIRAAIQRRRLRPNVVRAKKPATNSDSRKCIVYFTKNNEVVGERESAVPSGGFYPVVAMLSKGESLRVNLTPLTG